jgi:rhodanese-related sulfurtransferase
MMELEISATEAAALLRQGQARLVDVREPWEFATTRIAGSLPMPLDELSTRASQELEPGERLFIVCHHGIRSMRATVWLREQGFEQAQSLRGGIDAWSVEVDPALPRY